MAEFGNGHACSLPCGRSASSGEEVFTRSDEQIRDNWTANQNHDNCECMTDSFAHALLPGTID
jgi:hypothetical protein